MQDNTKQITVDAEIWERARLFVLERKVAEPRYSIKRLAEEAINRKLDRESAQPLPPAA